MVKLKKILIIMGHPSGNSLNFAVADAYEKGAVAGGFDVERLNLNELKFDPILHEGYNGKQKLEKDLIEARKKILWAEHIVWIFPVWWGGRPALLNGFIERVFLPGFAFKYVKGVPLGLLKGRSSSVICTSGSNKYLYFLFLRSGLGNFKRVVLNFCGIFRVKVKCFNSIRKISKERGAKILKDSKNMGLKGF